MGTSAAKGAFAHLMALIDSFLGHHHIDAASTSSMEVQLRSKLQLTEPDASG